MKVKAQVAASRSGSTAKDAQATDKRLCAPASSTVTHANSSHCHDLSVQVGQAETENNPLERSWLTSSAIICWSFCIQKGTN
jgi:hypothetical protein